MLEAMMPEPNPVRVERDSKGRLVYVERPMCNSCFDAGLVWKTGPGVSAPYSAKCPHFSDEELAEPGWWSAWS